MSEYKDKWKWVRKNGVFIVINDKIDLWDEPNLIFRKKNNSWIARAKRNNHWSFAKIIKSLDKKMPYYIYFDNEFYDASSTLNGAMDIANFWL
jgi:hypothetical protein